MKKFNLLAIIILILIFNIINVKAQNYSPYATRIRFVSSNPLTCFPNTFYYNSVSKELLVCSSLNTWTEVISASAAQYLAGNGTAALPSFSFTSDPDTGMFHSGTNSLGFSTNGVERWIINASGDFNPLINNTYSIGNGSVNPKDVNISRSLIIYGSTSGNVNLKSTAVTSSYNLIWPAAQGTGFLVNNGAGVFSWDNNTYLTNLNSLFISQTTNYVPRAIGDNTYEDSPIYAANSDIRINSGASGVVIIGDYAGAGNITKITLNDANKNVTFDTQNSVKFNNLDNNSVLYLDNDRILQDYMLNDGQILIGATGAIPNKANITGSSGITITNGANTIDISQTFSTETFYSSGTPSSISGGGGVLASGSRNSAGKFTTTTTGANTITITFSTPFSHAPACSVTNETTANLARGVSTTTTLVFSGVTVNGDTLSYTCLGY